MRPVPIQEAALAVVVAADVPQRTTMGTADAAGAPPAGVQGAAGAAVAVAINGLTGTLFVTLTEKPVMEKRILGIIFSLLGATGLILAAVNFVNGGEGTRNVKTIAIYAILGAVFFFSGVGLIKSTKDKAS